MFLEGDLTGVSPTGTFRKSHSSIVSSWELLTIWNSSNWRRNTLPECSCCKHKVKNLSKYGFLRQQTGVTSQDRDIKF